MTRKERAMIFATFKNYYVTSSGNNSNDGLTEGTAWATQTYAVGASSPVVAGDTIWVKAGNYGNENIVYAKSGIKGAKIKVIGYKTTPGDKPPLLVDSVTPYATYTSSDMPTYNGTTRNSGVWLSFNTQKYIKVANMQGATYAYGVTNGLAGTTTTVNTDKTHLDLYNINCMTLGDPASSYSGLGITLGSIGTLFGNGNTLSHCLIVNAGAEGITINGDYNKSSRCKVYCNDTTSGNTPTDYYFTVGGNYNVTENCYIERASAISGGHHGFTVKTNAEQVIDNGLSLPTINCVGNQFYNCSSLNLGESFCVRHRGAQYNYFYKCSVVGTHTGVSGPSGLGSCIVIRDGASNNIFEACIGKNCESGILLSDSVEDGDTGGSPTGHPGNNNLIINCIFINNYFAVDFSTGGIQSDAGANTISNCTFYKNKYHHRAGRHCVSMIYKNNIYHGGGATEGYFRGGTFSTDIAATQFTNCTFFNITGGMPGGFVAATTAGITTDPLFVDVTTDNFHLSASSPARDTGVTLSYVDVDYDEVTRPIGSTYSQGAFEK